jgi:hypothetical protein
VRGKWKRQPCTHTQNVVAVVVFPGRAPGRWSVPGAGRRSPAADRNSVESVHYVDGRRRDDNGCCGGPFLVRASASDHRPAFVMLRRRTCIRRAPARIVPIATVTRPPLTMLASNLAEKPWASMIASVAPVGPEVASVSRARRPSGLRRRVEGAGGFLSGVLSGMGQREPKCPRPPIAGSS